MGFLKVGAFALVAFGIAIYAAMHKGPERDVAVASQPAALSLAPVPVSRTIEGTIVFDNAPAADTQPYVLYTETKGNGTSVVKTKRLVLPSRYACIQGDIPCALPIGATHPFVAGDQVRIEGTADADLLYVHSIAIIR